MEIALAKRAYFEFECWYTGDEYIQEIRKEFGVGEVRELPNCPGYAITPDGKVFTCRTTRASVNEKIRLMAPCRGGGRGSKYVVYHLTTPGGRKTIRLSRLLALTYIPNEDTNANPMVRHLNDIKSDNSLGNLVWGSDTDNKADAIRNGIIKVGEKSHRSVLSDEDVRSIRYLYREHGFSIYTMLKIYPVCDAQLRRIVSGEQWKHLCP